jgi:hypothetical protein
MEPNYCHLIAPMDHYGPHDEDCKLGPKAWNEADHGNQKTTWTASLCDLCWFEKNEDRVPVRVKIPDVEICTNCGSATRSGIYYRLSPEKQIYKRWVNE